MAFQRHALGDTRVDAAGQVGEGCGEAGGEFAGAGAASRSCEGVDSMTFAPFWARQLAQARPLGPEPRTRISEDDVGIAHPSGHFGIQQDFSCGVATGGPITPPPGWVEEPHIGKPLMGDWYCRRHRTCSAGGGR